jgi:hypothetical protein
MSLAVVVADTKFISFDLPQKRPNKSFQITPGETALARTAEQVSAINVPPLKPAPALQHVTSF